jgi:hypothetical protein
MAKSEPDRGEMSRARSRDLAELRRLAEARASLERASPEWLELTRREAELSRKIREWASRDDEDG